MRIHLVGVAGSGMGALAGLLRSAGHEVSGSDVAFDPPIGPELDRWGVRCLRGYSPEHLDPAPERVVVGNVCRRDNPEAAAALARGLSVTTMPGALVDLVVAPRRCSTLVVSGTHGKTTTSSMAAWLLECSGLGPGFFIGGLPRNFPAGFRLPQAALGKAHLPVADDAESTGVSPARGVPFVIEGDEYDTAFFEKTPKFWHYRAEVGIVTSIEHDHVDIYPELSAYESAFRGFIDRLPPTGLCVAAASSPRVRELVSKHARCPVRWFALEGDDTGGLSPEWVGAPGVFQDGMQEFDLFIGGVARGRMRIAVPGAHNVRNALAAMAAAIEGYGAGLDHVVPALASFRGVRRRQDLVGEARGVKVYDDFAHHPTAVNETLGALRSMHPTGRLWAVFEPRSATACRALHQTEYASAFGHADRIILAPLGRSNVPEPERLDLVSLGRALAANGKDAQVAGSIEDIVVRLAREAASGDVIALLSNGAFGGIAARLLRELSK